MNFVMLDAERKIIGPYQATHLAVSGKTPLARLRSRIWRFDCRFFTVYMATYSVRGIGEYP